MVKLSEAPPTAEAAANPARPVRKVVLRPIRSASRPQNSSRLPVGVGESQRALRRRQREVHYGHVEDDHQRGGADGGEDQPPPWVRIAGVALTETPDRRGACCRLGC